MKSHMEDYKIVSTHRLQEMVRKIEASHGTSYKPVFDEDEEELFESLRPLVKFMIQDELNRLDQKIRNHHHITLSVGDGISYKENGMQIVESTDDQE